MKISFSISKGAKSLKKQSINASFTLIELLAAMGVLTIIMFVLISFFSSAQKAWTMSNARAETYENARIALDLITRDLQAIYYLPDKVPFWHVAVENVSWNEYRSNDMLCFISATPVPPNEDCSSNLCEIKYQKYYATDHSDSNDGWLRRSCTGDRLSGGGTTFMILQLILEESGVFTIILPLVIVGMDQKYSQLILIQARIFKK